MGLCCCIWAFSSRAERRLLSITVGSRLLPGAPVYYRGLPSVTVGSCLSPGAPVYYRGLLSITRGSRLLPWAGFSLHWLLLLWSMGSGAQGFRGCSTWAQQLGLLDNQFSCSVARGIFWDQELNLCFLDSLPLSHQRSPKDHTLISESSALPFSH